MGTIFANVISEAVRIKLNMCSFVMTAIQSNRVSW